MEFTPFEPLFDRSDSRREAAFLRPCAFCVLHTFPVFFFVLFSRPLSLSCPVRHPSLLACSPSRSATPGRGGGGRSRRQLPEALHAYPPLASASKCTWRGRAQRSSKGILLTNSFFIVVLSLPLIVHGASHRRTQPRPRTRRTTRPSWRTRPSESRGSSEFSDSPRCVKADDSGELSWGT